MKRYAFTMLELVFVIVIIGILGKFGVEFIAKAYKSFIFTSVNHNLQSNSAMAVEVIASRLQYRIKDSIIARRPSNPPLATDPFDALADVNNTIAAQYTVLEWISADIDGFRGDSKPYWSGIADVDNPAVLPPPITNLLISPETNTTAINNLIQILSDDGNVGTPPTTIANAALYFIGSNSDIIDDYGWSGNGAYQQALTFNKELCILLITPMEFLKNFIP
ncbi:MAG: prepilin-type N-terminal cleavage/methylation domain-containing protein [Sulfurimonas sp.]|nr:prepilin-type N-terminal cleavage/methylation domain-containing protein [Sulfurimonas sp.]